MKKHLLKNKLFYGGRQNRTTTNPTPPKRSGFGPFAWFFDQNRSTAKVRSNHQKPSQKIATSTPKHIFRHSNGLIQNQDDSAAANVKIFKPNPDKLKHKNLLQRLSESTKPPRRGRYGFKPLEQIRQQTGRLAWRQVWLTLKRWLLQVRLVERFNQLTASLLLAGSFLFVVYLTFFDRFFLVKDFDVGFSQNSYLDSQAIQQVVRSFGQDMFLGFVPNNQFWFLNEQNLTLAARKVRPEVVTVRLVERVWPNKARIEITTEPILVTLGINGREYWRISQDGVVLGPDEANLRENLVVVLSPITLTYSNLNHSGVHSVPTFADYSFEHRTVQLNRFWAIIWLWEQLKQLNIKYIKTAIPSLSDFDTDVIITTANNTELWFDINTDFKKGNVTDSQTIRKKLELIFNSSIGDREARGELKYIDFRTPKRVFVCPRDSKCAE